MGKNWIHLTYANKGHKVVSYKYQDINILRLTTFIHTKVKTRFGTEFGAKEVTVIKP